jgi:copper(I)-binding protein
MAWLVLLAIVAVFLGPTMIGHPHAGELPDVVVEEALLVPEGGGGATLFLVINNRSDQDVVLKSVQTGLTDRIRMVGARGQEFADGIVIPSHAELYMQPRGVRIELLGLANSLEIGSKVDLSLSLAEGLSATISATVLPDIATVPDHHDYRH